MFDDPGSWVSLIGVFLTGVAGFIGVRYTARSARKAQHEAEQRADALEKSKVDSLAYARARENYDSAISTLQQQVEHLKNGREYDRQEHQRQIQNLQSRVQELETGRQADRMTIATLAAYAHVLLGLLRDHKINYPPPPPDLSRH